MSVRYFQTPIGVAQYGNLTKGALQMLADAGYEEITAAEHQAEETRQAKAAAALLQPAAATDSTETAKEANADGGDRRKRRSK